LKELDHLTELGSERRALLDTALARLSQLTGRPKLALDDTATSHLRAAEMGDPLVLWMAAMVGHERSDLSPLAWRRLDLAAALAEHEERRIASLAAPEFLPLHIAAIATLTEGLTLDDLLDVCAIEKNAIQHDSPWNITDLAKLLQHKALPAHDPDLAVAPIVPDIVGEVFVEKIFRDPYHRPADTILRAFTGKPSSVVRSLVHMVQDFAPTLESPEVEERQQRVVQWLTDLLEKNVECLSEIDLWEIQSALPSSSIAMAPLARDFYRAILGIQEAPLWLQALALRRLAQVEHSLGDDVGALIHSVAAVKEYRQLADLDSNVFMPHLAHALSGHAALLSNTGQAAKELEVSTEALGICRELQRHRREASWELAGALLNHASALKNNGRLAEALQAIEEAIKHYREELLPINRDAYLPALAGALHDQATYEFMAGDLGEALASDEEALRYARELAGKNPDGFQPILVDALVHQAQRYRFFWQVPGSSREALPLIDEAIRVSRELVRRDRLRFLPNLASALAEHAVAEREGENGARAALNSMNEAIEYFRELAGQNRPRYLRNLAVCRSVLAEVHGQLGENGKAIKLITQGLQDCQELVETNRVKFLPDLMHALGVHTALLTRCGQVTEAVAPTVQAIKLGWELVRENPRYFLPELSRTYGVWGCILRARGSHPEAAEKFAEALRLIKPCALLLPKAHWNVAVDLAQAYTSACAASARLPDAGLSALFVTIVPLNREDELFRVLRERLYQTPAQDLLDLSRILQERAGEWGDSMRALAEEAIERHAVLAQCGAAAPFVIMHERAQLLETRANQWGQSHSREALDSIREAIPLFRLLAQQSPELFLLRLVFGLYTQAQLQHKSDQKSEALASLDEAISCCSRLALQNPDAFQQALLNLLIARAKWQYDSGLQSEALQTHTEVMSLLRDVVQRHPDQCAVELALYREACAAVTIDPDPQLLDLLAGAPLRHTD
jgi:tetratricopeptide (TPR) repeat protein